MTTRVPWTVIAILAVVFYWVAWVVRDRIPAKTARGVLIGLWVASFPVIYLVLLRDPDSGELVFQAAYQTVCYFGGEQLAE